MAILQTGGGCIEKMDGCTDYYFMDCGRRKTGMGTKGCGADVYKRQASIHSWAIGALGRMRITATGEQPATEITLTEQERKSVITATRLYGELVPETLRCILTEQRLIWFLRRTAP